MATINSRARVQRGENRLTDVGLKRLRLPPSGKAVLQDGGGLALELTEAHGRRIARAEFRFRLGGQRIDMRLGTWPQQRSGGAAGAARPGSCPGQARQGSPRGRPR